MTSVMKNLLLNLFSEQCFDTYFVEHDIFNCDCAKALLSKLLGIILISMSLVVKVPQIKKLWGSKTAKGLDLKSVLLELLAITIHISYCFAKGFPLTSWGDATFIATQTAIIAFLVLMFSLGQDKAVKYMGIYAVIAFVLISGITPMKVLEILQALKIPILLGSRFSQAKTNYINKSTGQLSAATCFLMLFGSAARIYTSIQETGDAMMIITFVLNTIAIGVIACQLIYYSDSKKTDGGKKKN
ncbi:MPDU1.2 family protein [Megaselia abdita]